MFSKLSFKSVLTNFTLTITLLTIFGCDYKAPQIISGTFYDNQDAVSELKIRIASGDHYENCDQASLEAITDNKGSIKHDRVIVRSRLDPYVQMDSLCIQNNGNWELVCIYIYRGHRGLGVKSTI